MNSQIHRTLYKQMDRNMVLYIGNQTGTKINKNISSYTYIEKYTQIWRYAERG